MYAQCFHEPHITARRMSTLSPLLVFTLLPPVPPLIFLLFFIHCFVQFKQGDEGRMLNIKARHIQAANFGRYSIYLFIPSFTLNTPISVSYTN